MSNRIVTRIRTICVSLVLAFLVALGVDHRPTLAAEPSQSNYQLVVNSDVPGFGADVLAEKLKLELGVDVSVAAQGASGLGVLTLSWRSSRGELAASFHDPVRGVVLRVVPAPADVDKAIQTSVFLAANLIRDDATELLGPEAATPAPVPPAPAAVSPAPVAKPEVAPSAPVRPFKMATFSIIHPLATNFNEPNVRTRLNLNLFYGHVGELDGLQLGTFGVVAGDASGMQLSFLANVTQGAFEGLQGATGFNLAKGGVVGLQAAVLGNLSGSRVKGTQTSLGVNVARETVTGGQVAAVNIAGDVEGFQIGLLNVAGKVKGLQLGLINIADDVQGVPIGLVSVTKSGGVHPMFWYGTETPYNFGIKFATRYTYSAITASAGSERGRDQLGPGALFGIRVPIAPLFFDSDLGGTYLFDSKLSGVENDRLLLRWRALLGFSVSKHLSGFVGGSATVGMHFRQGLSQCQTDVFLRPELIAGVML